MEETRKECRILVLAFFFSCLHEGHTGIKKKIVIVMLEMPCMSPKKN